MLLSLNAKVPKKIYMTSRQLFFNYLAQTSPEPPALEIKSAKGVYLYVQAVKNIQISSPAFR